MKSDINFNIWTSSRSTCSRFNTSRSRISAWSRISKGCKLRDRRGNAGLAAPETFDGWVSRSAINTVSPSLSGTARPANDPLTAPVFASHPATLAGGSQPGIVAGGRSASHRSGSVKVPDQLSRLSRYGAAAAPQLHRWSDDGGASLSPFGHTWLGPEFSTCADKELQPAETPVRRRRTCVAAVVRI